MIEEHNLGDSIVAAIERARVEARAKAFEEAAQMAASWRKPSVVKLAIGEMTAQELRTAQAVAAGIESAIRSRAESGNV